MISNRKLIKVGFCVAYDWSLLQYSIPPVYEYADVIFLSIDKDRISWAGNHFSWDESAFQSLIKKLDPLNKIKIIEEDYHLPELQPMQNEVRQRNQIAAAMGANDGWHIQLDTDEFFLNFKGFVAMLQSLNPKRKINISCPWITLYKQDRDGFFYVKPEKFKQVEFIQVATQHPHYEYGRRNGYFNIHCDYALLHLSWARSEEEIWEKLNNWGHKNDFDIEEYYKKWQALNKDNYLSYRNFHHVVPEAWPGLDFIKASGINDLLEQPRDIVKLPITKSRLKLENSIWLSRAKKYLQFK